MDTCHPTRFGGYTGCEVVEVTEGMQGEGWETISISICSRTAIRMELKFLYQLDAIVPLLCVKFRMSAIEIKPPVPRFPLFGLNSDNFARVRRIRSKFRVRFGWTLERTRTKSQSVRIFRTPRIHMKSFD